MNTKEKLAEKLGISVEGLDERIKKIKKQRKIK